MATSIRTKLPVALLIIMMALAFLSGSVGQVYAAPHHGHGGSWGGRYHGYGGYGGYGGYSGYSWYVYPYYSWYYPWSYSYYYPYYSGYYGYYPYSYGVGSYAYTQQYQLTLNTNPATLSNVVTGGGQFSPGTSASFSATQNMVQVSQDTRYVFSQWTGDYSGTGLTGSVTMDAAKTVTAVYQLQYYLSANAQPSNAPSPQGSGWFNAGTSTTITIPSQEIPVSAGTKLVFNGWTVDGNNQAGSSLMIQMNGPHTIVAQYKQQYYLTVSSDQGSVTGEGWYDAGSTAQISAQTPPSPGYGINMVFDGWQGGIQSSSQSTTVLMDGPKSVTATWHADATVLYVTIGIALAAIVAVAVLGAYGWSRRQRTSNVQSISYVQPPPSNLTTIPPSAPTSDAGSPAPTSNSHRHRRTHANRHPETSNPEETDATKTES